MRIIHKYIITSQESSVLFLPIGSTILTIARHEDEIVAWVALDPSEATTKVVNVYGYIAGYMVDEHKGRYISTVIDMYDVTIHFFIEDGY